MLDLTGWIDNLLPAAGPDMPDLVDSPCRAATYLTGLRDVTIAASKVRPLVRIADKNLDTMAELEGELSCSVQELMDDTGTCKITLLFDNWLADWITNQQMPVEDLHLLIDYNPARPNWRTRWGGKITEIHIKTDDRGTHTIELTALHHREHAKRILMAANPLFPPEIQLPRMWVMPGPVRTICAATMAVQLGRLFMPGWSTITNIFNPAAYLNPLRLDTLFNFLPTDWPIQVAFVNPFLDQSRWSAIAGAWSTDLHSAYKDVLSDAGVMMRAYTYLTTDEDSPNIELAQLLEGATEILEAVGVGEDARDMAIRLAAPNRNSVVFSFEDKSGHTGPTGTVADGVINTIAVTLDNLITPLTIDLTTGDTYDPGQVLNGVPIQDAAGIDRTYLLESLTLTAPEPPRVIWWDGTWNGMINTDLTWIKGSAGTIMTGSRSPTIVNQAQTFAIRYGLAQLSAVLNTWAANFLGGEAQLEGTPGLDNLYQGQLDNTLLAWQRYTDPIRALRAGDLKWQEHFEKGSGTAYTLSSVLTLRSGYWKTRPYASFKATALNGKPWIADYDYTLGDRVGFEKQGVIYVDNVFGIKREWDWNKPMTVSMTIGQDKGKDDPLGAAFRAMAGVYEFVGQLAGEGTFFE
jgi:hypothetical protein